MKSLLMAVVLVAFASSASLAADCLVFPAKMGKVTFNHKQHADSLKDCNLCHAKTPGKIEGFDKDKAHKLCIECHKAKKAGPVKCGDCHKK
ncbi:cytochrome C [bacterium]|nr:cytochrome C [bacterium]